MESKDIESRRYPDDAIVVLAPMTNVFELVCSESLPMFYDASSFDIDLNMKEGTKCYEGPTDPANLWFLNAASTLTYPDGFSASSQPPSHSLSRLYLRAWARGRGWVYEVYFYDVKYKNTPDGVGMFVERIYLHDPDEVDPYEDEPGQADDRMRHRVSQLLEMFRRCGKKLLLQPTDVTELERAGFDLER